MPSPPPPPSSFNMRPKLKKDTKKLKPLFWTKLNNASIVDSIWNETGRRDFSIDLSDLEDNFTITNLSSTTSSQLSITSARKQSVTTLLDITRANNVAIMLSRIKLDFAGIKRAILDLDDTKLSVDDLRAISRQLPTDEEVLRLKDFEDIGKLAKADQYFSVIMTIPRLSSRLESMLYRRNVELEIAEIRPELNILHNAASELRKSERFKSVLQAVLAVGNALNGSSFRGGARGFQLDALLKLKETKTAKGDKDCPTLLHYIARALLKKEPNLANFIEEMPHLEAAARTSVQTISQTLNVLVAGFAQVKEEIKQTKLTLDGDRFARVMQPFVTEHQPGIDALRKMGDTLDADLRTLLLYYGEVAEGPDARRPEDLFGMILSFSSSLQKCTVEVHDSQASKREQTKASSSPNSSESPQALATDVDERQGETTVKSSGLAPPMPQGSQGRSVGRGDLDQAIRSMRDGRRRPRPRPVSKIFIDGSSGGQRSSRLFNP